MFLCFLSFFIKIDFLKHFDLVKNYNIIYKKRENQCAEEFGYLHGMKAFMMSCSISAHTVVYMGALVVFDSKDLQNLSKLGLQLIFFFFRCSFFSQPFSSVTSQEVPPFIIPFIERFLFLASQLAIMGGFFSMFSWYDIIKNNPKKYNLKSYFMVRYFRLVMISIPMLLLYFVLPHLGELQFDYLLQNFIN